MAKSIIILLFPEVYKAIMAGNSFALQQQAAKISALYYYWLLFFVRRRRKTKKERRSLINQNKLCHAFYSNEEEGENLPVPKRSLA